MNAALGWLAVFLAAPPTATEVGPLDYRERTEVYSKAAAAAAQKDPIEAARTYALACGAETFWRMSYDVESCRNAAALAKKHELVDVESALYSVEGTLAAWQLDVERALSAEQKALAVAQGRYTGAEPEAWGVRTAWLVLGAMAIEGGRYDAALEMLERGAELAKAAEDHVAAAYFEIWRCRARFVMGFPTQARTHCTRALELSGGDLWVEMNAAWNLGVLEFSSQRHESAIDAFQRGMKGATRPGGQLLSATLRVNIAAALIELGRSAESRQIIQQLIAEVDARLLPESYRPQLEEQMGTLAAAEKDDRAAVEHYTRGAESKMHWIAVRSLLGKAAALRRLGDFAGARATYEEAIRGIEAERAMLSGDDQRATFLALHGDVYRELVSLLYVSEGARGAERALELAEAGRARSLLDALSGAGIRGSSATPLTASQLRAALQPGELLLYYVSTDRRLYALAVTRDRVHLIELPGTGTEVQLADRVSFFRQLAAEASSAEELYLPGAALYRDLLAPLLELAPPEIETLVIVPDGPLHALPFDALRSPEGFVVDRFIVDLLPSASLAAPPGGEKHPSRAVLAVADPPDRSGLGSLPYAREEARRLEVELADPVFVLEGEGASEHRVKTASIGEYRVLHFATHGLADETLPLRASLVLGAGGGEDGHLRAAEIYAMRLQAELVVLSACRTGLGRAADGEGLMSLQRAFLYAGASAVVATLWDVDDRAGAELMKRFYRDLAAARPIAHALTDAKRALRSAGAPPHAWAAYVVTGPSSARAHLTARVDDAPALPALAITFGAIAAALAFWRRRSPIAVALSGAAGAVGAVVIGSIGSLASIASIDGERAIPSAAARRGSALPAISSVEVTQAGLAWSAVDGADSYRVIAYSADGVTSIVRADTSSTALPLPALSGGSGDGWWKIEARAASVVIAESRLERANGM